MKQLSFKLFYDLPLASEDFLKRQKTLNRRKVITEATA